MPLDSKLISNLVTNFIILDTNKLVSEIIFSYS